MGKKKDARRAAEMAERERQKTIDSLVVEVAALKTRVAAAEDRVGAAAHSNDRVPT